MLMNALKYTEELGVTESVIGKRHKTRKCNSCDLNFFMATINEVSNVGLQVTSTNQGFQRTGTNDRQDGNRSSDEQELDGASTSKGGHKKPTIVRIKRKRSNEPIDNLWLEVSQPAKRQEILLSSLTLNDVDPTGATQVTTQRKLFRYLETLSSSSLKHATTSQLLKKVVGEVVFPKQKDHKNFLKSHKDKHDKLLATARKQHEQGARAARFEQIWNSRRGAEDRQDLMQEYFHLYDIVRVDTESEVVQEISRLEQAEREAENQLMYKYLPLLKEYLPSAAAELNPQPSLPSSIDTDDFVYDVYTVDPSSIEHEDFDDYPTVHVVEDWYYSSREPKDQDYDSQDSNDENNPNNDYPEEEDDSEIEYNSEESNADGSEETDFYEE